MTNATTSIWTDELKAEVTELWQTSKVTREIAALLSERLGVTVTKNAVIGIAHRLKLANRAKPAPRPKPPRVRKPKDEPVERKPTLRIINGGNGGMRLLKSVTGALGATPCVEVEPRNITIDELEYGDCRYVYGEGPFTFCDQPKRAGSSWCGPHHALCLVPPRYVWS